MQGTTRRATALTFVVTSVAAFMASLDNLVVTMALPSIRADLHAGLGELEWTVNAYTLSFAVLLLTASALGDRFGRRRVFSIGLALFTVASAAAAMAPSVGFLIAARAIQGAGGAVLLPMSMTILSAAVPANRRGAALGVWGAMNGLGVAVGPVVGGAVVQGAAWQWIFWLNVPIGLAILPLAWRGLAETFGSHARIDGPGVALATAGLGGLVYAVVRANSHGWSDPGVLAPLVIGSALVVGFLLWERRTPMPMLPLALFRDRSFAAVNATSFLFSFGMFGAIFLLAQALQLVYGYGPLGAGLRTLPWTAMPLLVAPLAGPLADRIGGRPLIATGMGLMAGGLAWIALVLAVGGSYAALVVPFILAGVGMALFFVPVGTVVFASAPERFHGLASGANNAIRELGGVFGIAALSSVFAATGSYAHPQAFVDGVRPATFVGAALVMLGGAVALLIRRRSAGVDIAPAPVDDAAEVAGSGAASEAGALAPPALAAS